MLRLCKIFIRVEIIMASFFSCGAITQLIVSFWLAFKLCNPFLAICRPMWILSGTVILAAFWKPSGSCKSFRKSKKSWSNSKLEKLDSVSFDKKHQKQWCSCKSSLIILALTRPDGILVIYCIFGTPIFQKKQQQKISGH